MPENGKTANSWFYGISLLFLTAVIYFLSRELYWAAAFPVVIGVILMALFAMDKVLLLIAFCTPLAIVLNDKSSGPAISVPTEPLLFGVLLLTVFKLVYQGGFDRKILFHPVSVAVLFMVFWKVITSMPSPAFGTIR